MAYKRRAAPRRYAPRRRSSAPSYRRATYKRRAAPRRSRLPRRDKCHCPPTLTPGAKFVLAQLDPFDASQVNGAKIPDSNTMPSIANTDTDIVNISTGATATNLVGMAFRPQYTWATVAATTGASLSWGAAWGTNASNRTKRTAYAAAMELTRPVAHAVRISSPIAPTSASGFVHIGLSTETIFAETSWTFPTTLAEMSGLQYYKRVTLASLTQSPVTVINKWLDDTGFRYSATTGNIDTSPVGSGFQTDYSWATIVIVVEGAPVSSTVLSVEHLLMSEGLPKKDGVIIGTVAAANSPETISAVGELSVRQEPFHTEAEQDSYINRGITAVAQGAAAHGENMFQQIAVPLLQRVGAYGVNVAANMAAMAVAGRGGIGGVNNNANRLML